MKKFLYIFICSCFVILGCLSFTGCGEQFIEERTYQLVNMQVIEIKLQMMAIILTLKMESLPIL